MGGYWGYILGAGTSDTTHNRFYFLVRHTAGLVFNSFFVQKVQRKIDERRTLSAKVGSSWSQFHLNIHRVIMGRLLVNALLLGLIGAASLEVVSAQLMAQGDRPEFPIHAKQGCELGARSTLSCPTRMECFEDKQFENGGRCDCE